MTKKIKLKKNSGYALWEKAKKIIPGGNQLLSKRAEMFLPGAWPSYYQKAKGAYVWGLDGRRYLDMSIMGIGTCVLGYANPDVNRAVKKVIDKGNMSTLNCPEEVELAQKLIQLHPWAGMVRFARTGGEACAVAVRIARAAAGKDKVLFCGYHGWSDWYISSNISTSSNLDGQLLPGLKPKGVPRSLKDTAIPFHYGNLTEFKNCLREHKDNIGVIIMEVQRDKVDVPFLKEVRKAASQINAVLIFDEITSGFRLTVGGLHSLYAVEPDIVVLGKAMGNGFPISAIVGRKEIMNYAQETFISSTYWTERIGFAAALEVIRQYETKKVPSQLEKIGAYFRQSILGAASVAGMELSVTGMLPAQHVDILGPDAVMAQTYFTQEMLTKGCLASNLTYICSSHTREMIDRFSANALDVFKKIKQIRKNGDWASQVPGGPRHTGFKRLT